ncbi:uncharacterized protein J7T54_000365 [Emericellopsis cladophorae]|uniref:NodB homology domain-containing protein n=1 Tax=Emericellopsis cladophorae TaxID=2686198 RepID=A0A9P9XW07_9HYPO|nr:uncharacterized protein J7T54_000365 [Emericellopsis cladophorae]KAI6778470.1 hypothetical protein J7T54_000365 [Emericellopsis cladophorae]
MMGKRQRITLLALATAFLATPVVTQRPQLGAVPYGVEIRSCTRPNMVALTFDDGPSHLTPDLLDLLDEQGVMATFFLNGNNMGEGPITDQSLGHGSVIRRIYQSGHQIGSHTWSHTDFNTISDDQRWDELVELDAALLGIIGIKWDLDTNDWKQDEQASRDTFSQTLEWQNSAIVLAHDIHEMTVYSLAAYMISTARAKGFSLVTVGECLGDPRGNWYRTGGSSSRTNTKNFQKQRQNLQEGSSSATPVSPDMVTWASSSDLSASVGPSVSAAAEDSDASRSSDDSTEGNKRSPSTGLRSPISSTMSGEDRKTELLSCVTSFFRTALIWTSCDESDLSCWCADANRETLAKGITECFNENENWDEGDIRRLMSSYQTVCDIAGGIVARQPTPILSVGDTTKTDSPRPTGSLKSGEGDLIAVPPPAPSNNEIPLAAKIGMAVGFPVLGLLCAILVCLYIRERRRRKGLEWTTTSTATTTPRKDKRSSLGSKRTTGTTMSLAGASHHHAGRHDSVRGTQGSHSDMRRSDSGVWRPSRSEQDVISPSSGESGQGKKSLGRVLEEPPRPSYFQELPS